MLIRTPTVSAAAAAPASVAAAPWRALFLQHLDQMPAPLCAVSTLHPAEDSSASSSSPLAGATPRVRHCVCRGLWASLADNPKNPAPRNPAIYESDLPVFTTDARMAKAWEISASAAAARRDGNESSSGEPAKVTTGGGGPIEAVWWAAEVGTQWRVRGTAWILGPDVEGPEGLTARTAIRKRMRPAAAPAGTDSSGGGQAAQQSGSSSEKWSWSREITAHFGNMSPVMRGSFRNPPPGQPRPPLPASPGRGTPSAGPDPRLGAPVDDDHLDDPAARANFRVCVIVPEQVEQVDLSRADDPRRWLFTYVGTEAGGDGEQQAAAAETQHEGREVINGWEKLEVWP